MTKVFQAAFVPGIAGILALSIPAAQAEESLPPPWPVPKRLIMAIPQAIKEPVVDGVIDPGEWADALQTGMFYHVELGSLAPAEIASVVYLKWDAEHLYVAMRGGLYPEQTSVRATERRPGAVEGIRQGDHAFFELLPLSDRSVGNVSQTGSFTWVWNPLNTMSDHHLNIQPGQRGGAWVSDATLANRVTDTHWESELSIPLTNLQSQAVSRQLQLPASSGDEWSFHAARRFGEYGEGIDLATALSPSVFTHSDSEEWGSAWETLPALRLTDSAVVMHIETLGDLTSGKLEPVWRFHNTGETDASVSIDLLIRDSAGATLFEYSKVLPVEAGAITPGPAISEQLLLEPSTILQGDTEADVAQMFLRIRDDAGNLLYIGPPAPFFVFSDQLRTQFRRALQILRE